MPGATSCDSTGAIARPSGTAITLRGESAAVHGARGVQRLHRVRQAQDPSHRLGRDSCPRAASSLCSVLPGTNSATATPKPGGSGLPLGKLDGIDVAHDLDHAGQMPMFHAARGVERGQPARVCDRQHHAATALVLDGNPALDRSGYFSAGQRRRSALLLRVRGSAIFRTFREARGTRGW